MLQRLISFLDSKRGRSVVVVFNLLALALIIQGKLASQPPSYWPHRWKTLSELGNPSYQPLAVVAAIAGFLVAALFWERRPLDGLEVEGVEITAGPASDDRVEFEFESKVHKVTSGLALLSLLAFYPLTTDYGFYAVLAALCVFSVILFLSSRYKTVYRWNPGKSAFQVWTSWWGEETTDGQSIKMVNCKVLVQARKSEGWEYSAQVLGFDRDGQSKLLIGAWSPRRDLAFMTARSLAASLGAPLYSAGAGTFLRYSTQEGPELRVFANKSNSSPPSALFALALWVTSAFIFQMDWIMWKPPA